VSPSGTRGVGSTKVRAGRRQTLGCEPELITWPPLATGPDALRARISRCRVARELPFKRSRTEGTGMRIIGLDIHRAFAEAVAWKDGKLSRLGRVIMRRERLEEFAKQLSNSDIVTRGLDRRRADASATPPGDAAQPDRAAAFAAEEHHSVDLARPFDPVLPASESVWPQGPGLAFRTDPARG